MLALGLPLDAQIVDWIDLEADSEQVRTPASPAPCDLSPLQVPLDIPWAPVPDMLCLERPDPESGLVARILSYGADPGSVAPGEKVTIRWDAEGGEMVLLEVYDSASIQNSQKVGATSVPLAVLQENLPLTGTQSVLIPEDMAGDARIILWVVDRGPAGSAVAMYKRLAFAIVDLPRADN